LKKATISLQLFSTSVAREDTAGGPFGLCEPAARAGAWVKSSINGRKKRRTPVEPTLRRFSTDASGAFFERSIHLGLSVFFPLLMVHSPADQVGIHDSNDPEQDQQNEGRRDGRARRKRGSFLERPGNGIHVVNAASKVNFLEDGKCLLRQFQNDDHETTQGRKGQGGSANVAFEVKLSTAGEGESGQKGCLECFFHSRLLSSACRENLSLLRANCFSRGTFELKGAEPGPVKTSNKGARGTLEKYYIFPALSMMYRFRRPPDSFLPETPAAVTSRVASM
jgi:hypothetical protein